jgi:hypothetical protein
MAHRPADSNVASLLAFRVHAEFVPAVCPSRLTASGAVGTFAFGLLQKQVCIHIYIYI